MVEISPLRGLNSKWWLEITQLVPEGHLILIDNDEEVIRTLNRNKFTLIQNHYDTNQVDVLKAANTIIDRRYHNLSLQINESIGDIFAEMEDIQ